MSLPASAQGGNQRSGDVPPVAPVHVRVMGPPDAVAEIARRLHDVFDVAEESGDYPRRRDLGVRRYLTVLVPAEVPAVPAEEPTG